MNKKLLCAALLAGIGCVQAANAQAFDDRWYVSGSVGYNFQDSERMTAETPFGTLGIGNFLSPTWSMACKLTYQTPTSSHNDTQQATKEVGQGEKGSEAYNVRGHRTE